MEKTRDLRMAVLVRCEPERVYRALTAPAQLRLWWGAAASARPRNGGRIALSWPREGSPGRLPQGLGKVSGLYVDLEPGRKVAWVWEAGRHAPGLVSFFITPLGRACEVAIQHCGFARSAKAAACYEGFRRGWTDALTRLKRHLEDRHGR